MLTIFTVLPLLLPALTLALPATPNTITYIVSNFLYTEHDTQGSNATFTLIDPRPEHALNITCTSASTQSHVPTTFVGCEDGENKDALFSLTMSSLTIQRGWTVDEQYYMWTRAPVDTYWTPGVNVTDTDNGHGKEFRHDGDWEFLVTSAWV
ncbi:hypothetical protein K491DRAFT_760828 [Lophiostoma macrostomum CBS 122681]|uniref:AA1-like domain-containing protein n=1 Tax=Lophiostoma macrostomum CBS 122681 TaxID=1314788 RepID=A0A6A6SXJ7_9PLEO|nr:hypothetical protein K491DRAFT_760828 [Lophiostoma macrostomum CBS 122681]